MNPKRLPFAFSALRTVATVSFCCIALSVCAQVPDTPERNGREAFREALKRTTVGMEIATWAFTPESFYLEFSPTVNYRFSESTQAGAHFVFQMFEDSRYRQPYSSQSYGARLYLRRRVFSVFGVHGEFDNTHYWFPDSDGEALPGEWYQTVRLGAYGVQRVGDRSQVSCSALFDLNWRESRSVAPTPLTLRFGFQI